MPWGRHLTSATSCGRSGSLVLFWFLGLTGSADAAPDTDQVMSFLSGGLFTLVPSARPWGYCYGLSSRCAGFPAPNLPSAAAARELEIELNETQSGSHRRAACSTSYGAAAIWRLTRSSAICAATARVPIDHRDLMRSRPGSNRNRRRHSRMPWQRCASTALHSTSGSGPCRASSSRLTAAPPAVSRRCGSGRSPASGGAPPSFPMTPGGSASRWRASAPSSMRLPFPCGCVRQRARSSG